KWTFVTMLKTVKTVFVLGAGASFDSGVPLMADFLRRAKELRRDFRSTTEPIQEFDIVFRAMNELQKVHSKARLATRNVETLFSAFEMAKTIGKFPGL